MIPWLRCAGFDETTQYVPDMHTCTQRAFSGFDRGTSNGDAPYLYLDNYYFSTDPTVNPLMYKNPILFALKRKV